MRVYLAPCGIGLGHTTRVRPIAEELNRRGFKTVYSTYLDGLDYARHNFLPVYAAVPINFKVTNEGAIDFKKTAATSGFSLGIRTFLRQVVREIQYLKQFRPDVVVSDSRASSLLAGRLLRIPVVLILNQFRIEIIRRPTGQRLTLLDRIFFFIANIGWLFVRTTIQLVWGRSQIILIPDLPAPYTISQGNLAIPRRYNGKVKLIGPIVELDEPKTQKAVIRRKLGFDSERPLIYAAISGPKVERKILVKILLRAFQRMSKDYQIVLSKGEPKGSNTSRLENGVRVFGWIPNDQDYLRACDLVIARAGHGTIMKALRYGKPMVLVPIPDHTEQYGNASRAVSLQVAEIIDQDAVNTVRFKAKIENVLTRRKFVENSTRIGREAASMRAVMVASDVIESLAQH